MRVENKVHIRRKTMIHNNQLNDFVKRINRRRIVTSERCRYCFPKLRETY